MKSMIQIIACFFVLGLSTTTHAFPVIYDTDMAIDDWFALLYLAKNPDAEIKAVTISCSGESHCDTGTQNAISLLDLVPTQKPIPVAAGDAYPLDGYFVFPSAWRKDADTLSGVAVAKASYAPSTLSAVEVLHQTISLSKTPITIIAVGPLTNIAQWLLQHPNDVKNVNRLVIMGGALDTKGNIIVPGFTDKHPNTKAEWNFFVDPLAVEIVLNSALNIQLVGLDVTNHVRVTHEYVAHFKALVDTPAGKFAKQVYEKNDWFIDSGEYYFWDVLAALTTTNPELCTAEPTPLAVQVEALKNPTYLATSALNMPAKRWDGKPRSHLKAESGGVISRTVYGPVINVCIKTNAKKALKLFTETLTN